MRAMIRWRCVSGGSASMRSIAGASRPYVSSSTCAMPRVTAVNPAGQPHMNTRMSTPQSTTRDDAHTFELSTGGFGRLLQQHSTTTREPMARATHSHTQPHTATHSHTAPAACVIPVRRRRVVASSDTPAARSAASLAVYAVQVTGCCEEWTGSGVATEHGEHPTRAAAVP